MALLSVSWYSVGGSESATMPAAGLDVGHAVLEHQRADGDGRFQVAVAVEEADRAGVGPALVGSSSAMISIARIFGAPVTVPAGKHARSASIGRRPSRSWPTTFETMCMTCE